LYRWVYVKSHNLQYFFAWKIYQKHDATFKLDLTIFFFPHALQRSHCVIKSPIVKSFTQLEMCLFSPVYLSLYLMCWFKSICAQWTNIQKLCISIYTFCISIYTSAWNTFIFHYVLLIKLHCLDRCIILQFINIFIRIFCQVQVLDIFWCMKNMDLIFKEYEMEIRCIFTKRI